MKGLEEYLAKLDTLYRKTGKTEFDSLETGIPSAALDALEKMGFIKIKHKVYDTVIYHPKDN